MRTSTFVIDELGRHSEYLQSRLVGDLVMKKGLNAQNAVNIGQRVTDVLGVTQPQAISKADLTFLGDELAKSAEPDWEQIRAKLKVGENFTQIVTSPFEINKDAENPESTDQILSRVLSLLNTVETQAEEDELYYRFTTAANQFSNLPPEVAKIFLPLAEGFSTAADTTDSQVFHDAMLSCSHYIRSPHFAENVGHVEPWLYFASSLESIAAATTLTESWALNVFEACLRLTLWFPELLIGENQSKCPPCPDSCPHEGRTQWVKFKLSNPHNCKITTTGLKIRGIGATIIKKTCEWDADVRYKVIAACYKTRMKRFWAKDLCCKRIREWNRRETWTRTQAAIEIPFKGVRFPTKIADIEIRLKKLAIPADATG